MHTINSQGPFLSSSEIILVDSLGFGTLLDLFLHMDIYTYRIFTYRKQRHLGFFISVLHRNVSFKNCSFQSTNYSVDISMLVYIDISHSLF